jgi:hypothetical protein
LSTTLSGDYKENTLLWLTPPLSRLLLVISWLTCRFFIFQRTSSAQASAKIVTVSPQPREQASPQEGSLAFFGGGLHNKKGNATLKIKF